MITINGKEYRNLQEQVLENMDEIESLKNKEADDLLATGIAAGQVLTADGNGGTEWAPGSGTEEAVQAPTALVSGNIVVGTTGGDRNVATLAAGALGDVLTQGAGAPTWTPLNVEGSNVKSTGVTSGKVLTADGQGDASWEPISPDAEAVQAPNTLAAGNVVIGTTGGYRKVATLASGALGDVLTQGAGAPVWAPLNVEGEDVKATGATAGQVLTADGNGGAAWAAAGGAGDVTASGTLSVGSVMVGLGGKLITALNGSNGKILGWNGGAVWQDPPKIYAHSLYIQVTDENNNLYTIKEHVYSTQNTPLVTDVASFIEYVKKYADDKYEEQQGAENYYKTVFNNDHREKTVINIFKYEGVEYFLLGYYKTTVNSTYLSWAKQYEGKQIASLSFSRDAISEV